MLTLGMTVDNTLFANFWNGVGAIINLTDPSNTTTGPYTFAQVLTQISTYTLTSTASQFTISASISNISVINNASVSGQLAVWYVKQLSVGDKVANKYDANALGYWGNALWEETPYYDSDQIIFGTGQSHSSPLSERLYYSQADRNYRLLKVPLVDLTNQYVNALPNPPASILNALNAEKISFNETIRQLAVQNVRSPRGQISYTDSVVAVSSRSDKVLFAVRSVPCDVFTFLGKNDPLGIFPNPSVDLDGDLSSGIFVKDSLISAVAKHGAAVLIDISNPNNINYLSSVYVGPNGTLGGTNYSSSFSENKGILVGLTTNGLDSTGSVGSDGQSEKFVTGDGMYVTEGNSVAFGFDQNSVQVEWYKQLVGTQCGATTVWKKSALTCDGVGNLYSLDIQNGNVQQMINAAADSQPMIGGIARPSVDKSSSQIFWIASYNLPLPPFANPIRQYGWTIQFTN